MKKTKAILVIFVLLMGTLWNVQAQSVGTDMKNPAAENALLDSLNAFRPVMVDSTLLDKSIFSLLPTKYNGYLVDVNVHQSSSISHTMERLAQSAKDRVINGYRVRIYFDNKQDSRNDSQNTLIKFRAMYPEIPAYRSYQNPFFKVTVGDYRTKSEAMHLLNKIKFDFPSAFVVKDQIQFPL